MSKSKSKSNDPRDLPEDGIVLCYKCGVTINLNEEGAEAFQCDGNKERFFCSNNCLREYVLADLD